MQPDITAIDRAFDYLVPEEWEADGRADDVRVGAIVRIDFGGRRTRGWVTEVDVEPDPSVELQPLAKWSSHGPPGVVIELARWAAWRWAGRVVHLLRAASPPRMVTRVPDVPPRPALAPTRPVAEVSTAARDAFSGPVTVVRTTPSDEGGELARAAASLGRALLLVPTVEQRRRLAAVLRSSGVAVAEYDEQWNRSASGVSTVGTRRAAFAPMREIDAVLVLDEHSSAHKEERTPSWNARDVAIERARRAGVPCVLASPSPSLEALEAASRQLVPERSAERHAWPIVDVVDLRAQDRPGLLTEHIVPIVRGSGSVACVLNRKGRARMLACTTCGSLASCTECGAALRQVDSGLECPRDATTRPVVCAECGGTAMKTLRVGITRMAEELAALARREVVEVSAETPEHHLRGDRLYVGTEALLHRLDRADAVVFLDFDQELAVPRYRAAEEAFAMLALASRRLGPRDAGGRLVVQTRRPDDVVVQGALHGDPGRVARAQRDVRRVFSQPPYGAWALVSGEGAESFVASLHGAVTNRLGDRWRISAPDHAHLLEAIDRGERPAGRLRIEVDPLRV